jgi:hypothetical protein
MRQVLVFIVSAWSASWRAISVFLAQAELEALVFDLAGSVDYRWASRATTVVAVAGLEGPRRRAIVIVARRHGLGKSSSLFIWRSCSAGGRVW